MNKKCQVFTPIDYANRLLDCIGYTENLFGKKVLENSCGDGNILSIVVQRYIDDCKKKGLSKSRISDGLRRDINGYEIDDEQYNKCRINLDSILLKNNIPSVEWQLHNKDYLKAKDNNKYDYIVGNPPYITYSELKKGDQDYLKKHFKSCEKGKFDYCYAFIEKSLDSLSENAKMSYLIPCSIFKTVFGERIREIMKPHVVEIYDYTQGKVFKEVLVKSSIIVFDKNSKTRVIHYNNESQNSVQIINKDDLDIKWVFGKKIRGKERFGNYYKVSHVVATLCNKAFVLKQWKNDDSGNYIIDKGFIEADVVKKAASPRILRDSRTEMIIFPYKFNDNQLSHYTEDEFKQCFPGAYNYLNNFRDNLEKRDSDNAALWFEYGRSQALNSIICEKALISTVISNEISIHKLGQEYIPYAGMYITALGMEKTIEEGIEVLMGEDFLKYARNIGIPINGKSVRITSKDIEGYLF